MKRNIIGLVCVMGLVLSACHMNVTNERVIKLKTGSEETSSALTITFDPAGGTWGGGGNSPKSITVTFTSGIPLPAEKLTRADSYFTGWNTKADGAGDPFGASYPVSEDITVYAQWEDLPPNAVTVTFDKNSEEAYDASPSVIPVQQDSPVGMLPQAPFREGYDFTGWNIQADGEGSAFTAETEVTAGITVYAQWNYNPNFPKYTVIFNSDGAETEAYPRLVKVSGNGGNTMPATLPKKSGKVFDGWYTEKNGGGVPFSASFIVGADMTVYAWWTDPPAGDLVTVTFDKNSEKAYDANPREKTIQKGETIPLDKMPQDPFWAGHYVKSWKFAKDGSGKEFTSLSAVTDPITVYAQWGLSSYTVQFVDTDGTPLLPNQTIVHDTWISEPLDPSKDGFVFEGWYWEESPLPNLKWDFSIYTVAGDITLYARWEHCQPFTAPNRMAEYLKAQKELGKGKNEYDPVPLEVKLDLGVMTENSSNWQNLLRKIYEEGIYVTLDLSEATLNDMTDGEFNPVYQTAEDVRKGKSYITSLTLPRTALKITEGTESAPAFYHFTSMSDVHGEGVAEIGANIFCGSRQSSTIIYNYKLLEADFPAAEIIGAWAFSYCLNLKEANYPNAAEIGDTAFYFCINLNKMNFEEVWKIGMAAFYYCTNLTEATFPKATEIGPYAFGYCTSLITLRFDILERFSGSTKFLSCNKLAMLICPEIKEFGSGVFSGIIEDTGLTIIMGSTAPDVDSRLFGSDAPSSKIVTVKVPSGAMGYDENWKNRFKDGEDFILNVVFLSP